MDGTVALAICLSKMKKIASGVKKVEASTDGTKLIFTLNDGANTKININIPNPVTTYQLCNKLSIDSDGDLCYDNVKVCKWSFTQAQEDLLKKFTVDANGSIFFDSKPLASLTQADKDNIDTLTQGIKATKDSSGNIISINILDMPIEPVKDAGGNIVDTKINGQIVVTQDDIATTVDDGMTDFFDNITL